MLPIFHYFRGICRFLQGITCSKFKRKDKSDLNLSSPMGMVLSISKSSSRHSREHLLQSDIKWHKKNAKNVKWDATITHSRFWSHLHSHVYFSNLQCNLYPMKWMSFLKYKFKIFSLRACFINHKVIHKKLCFMYLSEHMMRSVESHLPGNSMRCYKDKNCPSQFIQYQLQQLGYNQCYFSQ
jgi:hypothetical protein